MYPIRLSFPEYSHYAKIWEVVGASLSLCAEGSHG